MATRSSILAWEISSTEELGRLDFMGRRESDKTGYACARTHTQLLRDEVRRGDRMQIKERLRGLHKESGVYPIANEKLRNVGINVLCIRQAIPVGIYRWTRKRAKIGGRMP